MYRDWTLLRCLVPLLLLALRPAALAADPAIRFLDSDGRATDRILFGRDYQVEIADPAGDLYSGGPDSLFAPIFSSEWGWEFSIASVFLQETGVATGVFRGHFQPVAQLSDCNLTVACVATAAGSSITARHPLQAPDRVETSALFGRLATLDLTDEAGKPLTEILEGRLLRLRLVDADQDAGLLESRTVSAGSQLGGDLESVILWETAAYSGIFTGTLPSRFLPAGGALAGDGELGLAAEPQPPPATGESIALQYAGAHGNPPAEAAIPTLAARLIVLDGGLPAAAILPTASRHLTVQLEYPALAAAGQLAVFEIASGDDRETFTQAPGSQGLYTLELPCEAGWPSLYNGRLETSPGDTLLVRSPLFYGHTGELQASLPVAEALLRFVDPITGSPLQTSPDLRPFKVQLSEAGNDTGLLETRAATLATRIEGVDRQVQLAETNAASGVFEALVEPTLGYDYSASGIRVARRQSIADRGGVFDHIIASADGGPATAVLELEGPVAEWMDAAGRPADRLHFGDLARVRIEDPGLDQNPQSVENHQVAIWWFSEDLMLTETGDHTGIFEGSMPVVEADSEDGNGVLEFNPADSAAILHYQMPNPWGGYLQRPIQGTWDGQLFFLDAAGNPTTSPLEGEDLRLRLIDFDPARSPTIADQLQVRLRSTHWALDDEWLTVTETAGNSGIFEGGMPTALAPAVWGDGILQVARGADLDTVLATGEGAAAEAGFVAARLRLLDRLGREIDTIGVAQTLVVEVTRPTGGDSGVAEVLPWMLRIDQLGNPLVQDFEAPNLVEKGAGTNLFRAALWIAPAFGQAFPGDGMLQVDKSAGFIHVRFGAAPAMAEKSLGITPGEPPYPIEDSVELAAGGSATLDLLANDFDPQGGELSLGSLTLESGQYTSATINGDGTVTLTGAADAHGVERLSYLVGNAAGLLGEGSLVVRYETPPTLTIVGPANGSVFAAQSEIHLSAMAADLDDGDLGYGIQWSSSLRPFLGYGPNPVLPAGYLPPGTHLVTARVTDQNGNSATATVTIVVIAANTAPVVAILSPASGARLAVGDAVTLSGSAADAESGNLAAGLAWSSSLAGSLGTGSSITTAALGVGSHTIAAVVTDPGGLAGSAAITLVVQVVQVATFVSAGALDGFVLESGENTNAGGQVSSGQLRLGDNLADRQYRTFLSFDTASLPDTAVIRKATVKAMRSGITGVNPATTHGSLSADVKTGFFGAGAALENADFADPATAAGVSLLTPAAVNGGWTEGVFDAAGRAAIGLTGTTQVRLQLSLDDDDDSANDYLDHYGGESTVASTRPQLIVEYLP